MSTAGSSATTPAGGVYLLDTSILILSLRGDGGIRARLAGASRLYIPSIALGELYVGAYGSPTREDEAVRDIDALATGMTILATDTLTAPIYGRAKSDLKRRGYAMPDNDIWIAATAMQHGLTLAARDTHFDLIGGLAHEQW
ncbi:MAG: PIN domain-containing protein [Ktedonobacterales bacterium]